MFLVQTPEGERCMVQLTGAASYRMRHPSNPEKSLYVTRGGTLTVSKTLRDYLVKKTPHFSDFDPTPVEEVDEILPPQFGGPALPEMDEGDFDMKANPVLTIEQAQALAAAQAKADMTGRGDMTGADLPKNKEGKSADADTPKTKMTVGKPKTATAKPVEKPDAETVAPKGGAQTVA